MDTTTTRPGLGEVAEDAQHALDLHVVEVGGRLVGQEQGRVVGQRPGDGDPLLLAARQVAGPVAQALAEADPLEQRHGLGPGVGPADARGAQRHHDVLDGVEAGDEVEGLEHDADA